MFFTVTLGANWPARSGQRPTALTMRSANCPVRCWTACGPGSRTLTETSWQYQLPAAA
jgi:hypothetical protein